MSTNTLSQTNLLVDEMRGLAAFFADTKNLAHLVNINVDWASGEVQGLTPEISHMLLGKQMLSSKDQRQYLSSSGIYLLGKLLVDIEGLKSNKPTINGKYEIEKMLVSGKNSVTFKARHKSIGREFALKVIRPGRGSHIEESLGVIGRIDPEEHLVHPIDFFEFDYQTINGGTLQLKCLVFEFIEGDTLQDFLSKNPLISPYFILAFISQVGSALAALEKEGLSHGDLHSNNILVRPRQKTIDFRVIDISYGVSSSSSYEYAFTDFQSFQEHLWRALVILQKKLPGMSLRKHLGSRIYSLVEHILSSENLTFSEIVDLHERNSLFQSFQEKRKHFLSTRFEEPKSIGLLRYEEITDPKVALALFEPYPQLLQEIAGFGNAIIYGHRGSGKSTYLASLAFFPEVAEPIVNFRERFGVFFPCRQGEFRQYSAEFLDFKPETALRVKHIVVLKIIRRIIDILRTAIDLKKLEDPQEYDALYGYVQMHIAGGAVLHYDRDLISPLENLHASVLRNEIVEIDRLFGRNNVQQSSTQFLNERSLIEFTDIVRNLFPELRETQFYFLFDDAGAPNISKDTQRILNDIVRCVNSSYCVKLSAERYSYEFQDTSAKILEQPHDYSVFDISATLCLGSGLKPERGELRSYFEKILNKRLTHANYKSRNIVDYLGEDPVSVNQLVAGLSEGKKDAYYCGWNVVWQLSDRTTRHLLELVSDIFSAANITAASKPEVIKPRIQHRAIKSFSEKKLKSLVFIPGEVDVVGEKHALGSMLYDFTATFGKISRLYLTHSKVAAKRANRRDERLAIERNDSSALAPNAQAFLHALIRFAILDDSKLEASRDDQIKKPIYILNRIFCPAFGISFRRDQHLRVSREKFERFLLQPNIFIREGTQFLKNMSRHEIQDDWFPETRGK